MAETIATNIRLPRALHADLAELAKAGPRPRQGAPCAGTPTHRPARP